MYSINDDRVIMQTNGLKAAFHMPAAVLPKFKRKDGTNWHPKDGEEDKEEVIQGLPPGAPRFVFPVDEYPGCPTHWMHGSAKASSYWLPVRSGCGMWLDLNYNYGHSHHVACVVSIQGVNPITGQQTKKLRLEQYREKCPVHDIPFGQDRFCESCNYKWDAQNYVASNCTPKGLLWIDGFRHGDGVVRQYIFTKETCKGVAAQIAGEERVFAIGIAFYLSKKPKAQTSLPPELTPVESYNYTSYSGHSGSQGVVGSQGSQGSQGKSSDIATFKRISIPLERRTKSTNSNSRDYSKSYAEIAKGGIAKDSTPDIKEIKTKTVESLNFNDTKAACAGFPTLSDPYVPPNIPSVIKFGDSPSLSPVGFGTSTTDFDCDSGDINQLDFAPSEKFSPADIDGELRIKTPEEIDSEMEKLEISAGARIRQKIYTDPEELDFWQDEPAGFVYINYVDLKTAEKIMEAGKKEMAGSFLSMIH